MSNAEQIEYWNGDAGKRWADSDARMANLLSPITEALLVHAPPRSGWHALDIGCGGGSQSVQLAELLGPEGNVTGIDISAPLLAVARQRTVPKSGAGISFLEADASTHAFVPERFDLLFSRFGVMFFDDPAAAFANLRRALKPEGRLAFCCWQALKENDWTWLPLQAALKHIAPPPPQPEGAPGPFSFADPTHVEALLSAAGFDEINLAPRSVTVTFGEASDLAGNVREMAAIGPLARLLGGLENNVMDAVFADIENAVAPFYDGEALRMPGSVWFVTA